MTHSNLNSVLLSIIKIKFVQERSTENREENASEIHRKFIYQGSAEKGRFSTDGWFPLGFIVWLWDATNVSSKSSSSSHFRSSSDKSSSILDVLKQDRIVRSLATFNHREISDPDPIMSIQLIIVTFIVLEIRIYVEIKMACQDLK